MAGVVRMKRRGATPLGATPSGLIDGRRRVGHETRVNHPRSGLLLPGDCSPSIEPLPRRASVRRNQCYASPWVLALGNGSYAVD